MVDMSATDEELAAQSNQFIGWYEGYHQRDEETEKLREAAMTNEERALLLTVARLLRAKIRNEVYAEQEDDIWAICDAIKPFDGKDGIPLNQVYTGPEYNGGDTPPV